MEQSFVAGFVGVLLAVLFVSFMVRVLDLLRKIAEVGESIRDELKESRLEDARRRASLPPPPIMPDRSHEVAERIEITMPEPRPHKPTPAETDPDIAAYLREKARRR